MREEFIAYLWSFLECSICFLCFAIPTAIAGGIGVMIGLEQERREKEAVRAHRTKGAA